MSENFERDVRFRDLFKNIKMADQLIKSDVEVPDSFYETLLSNLTPSDSEKPKLFKRSEKIIKSYVIPLGSPLDGKKIKEVDWGRHSLIITVERGEESITPNGDVLLRAGDEIVFLVSQRRYAANINRLENLFATN